MQEKWNQQKVNRKWRSLCALLLPLGDGSRLWYVRCVCTVWSVGLLYSEAMRSSVANRYAPVGHYIC